MRARIAVDVDARIAAEAFKAVGIEAHEIAICTTVAEAAWSAGSFIPVNDLVA